MITFYLFEKSFGFSTSAMIYQSMIEFGEVGCLPDCPSKDMKLSKHAQNNSMDRLSLAGI